MILSQIFHEATHFALNKIFKNNSDPFFSADAHIKNKFINIIEDIESNLNKIKYNDTMSELAYYTIESVFENYPEKEYAKEMAVKVPEILGLLGVEEGQRWLQENVPALLDFYIHEINPKLNNYLIEHQVDRWLDLSSRKKTTGNKNLLFTKKPSNDRTIEPEINLKKDKKTTGK